MASPSDISDLPESEIPWEFLVDAPDRRSFSRKESTGLCNDLCGRVIDVENRVTLLANEFYTYKRSCAEDTKESNAERKEIIHRLDVIGAHLDKQKGFFAGAVWAGSAVLGVVGAAIGVAISYFKA